MTPQQMNELERRLQQNHVDIQRLWKAAYTVPEPYVGMPTVAIPGGLTTDTTQTTSTSTSTTTTLTTLPPGPCDGIEFSVTVYWTPNTTFCDLSPGCPSESVLPEAPSEDLMIVPCVGPYLITVKGSYNVLGSWNGCRVYAFLQGPPYYPVFAGNVTFESPTFGSTPAIGQNIILKRIHPVGDWPAINWPCYPALVVARRTS